MFAKISRYNCNAYIAPATRSTNQISTPSATARHIQQLPSHGGGSPLGFSWS